MNKFLNKNDWDDGPWAADCSDGRESVREREREREGERCSVLTLEYKNKKFLIQHFLSELFSSDRRRQDHTVLGTFNMRTRIDEVHIKWSNGLDWKSDWESHNPEQSVSVLSYQRRSLNKNCRVSTLLENTLCQ